MEDLGTYWEDFRDKWSFCDSLFCDTILEVRLGCVTIPSTGNIWFIDSCLELRWCLSVGTLDTSVCGSIPFLWGNTTCTWFVVGEIIITTHCLDSSDDATFIFVISTTIHTVSTLTALFPTTDSIIVTNSCFTGGTTSETFFLSCTVELSFSTGGWDTTIFL